MPQNNNTREEWLRDEDLTLCVMCEKPYEHPLLHIVDINIGIFDQRALNSRLGMAQMWGNVPGSAALARIMGPYSEGVVRMNTDPEAKARILLCNDCFSGDINLAALREKADILKKKRDEIMAAAVSDDRRSA